jgi:hypothetical protein
MMASVSSLRVIKRNPDNGFNDLFFETLLNVALRSYLVVLTLYVTQPGYTLLCGDFDRVSSPGIQIHAILLQKINKPGPNPGFKVVFQKD